MYNFNHILKCSLNREKKDIPDELLYSEKDAQPFYRMVKQYYKDHPEASEKEVYDYFSNLFIEINQEVVKLPAIRSMTLEYNTCKFLNKNEKERRDAYDKIIREEKAGRDFSDKLPMANYSSNKLSSIRTLTVLMLNNLRREKAEISEEVREKFENFFRFSSNKEQREFKNKLDSNGRKEFDKLKRTFSGSEFEQFSYYMKNTEVILEQKLRDAHILSLEILGKRFKQLGVLENYCNQQEKLFGRLNLRELLYPVRENEEGTISVEDLFRRENLERLSINKLSVLNAFWLNRYAKELEAINRSFFITKSLKNLEQIKKTDPDKKNGNIHIPIEKNDLKNLNKKINFLGESFDIILNKLSKDKNIGSVETVENETVSTQIRKINVEDILEDFKRDIGEEYKKHFDDLNPNIENDFLGDMEDYRIIGNAQHNTYRLKDWNIIAFLSNLYEEGFSKNWGIIPENNKDSKMILVAVDMQGLNMPVRLHIEKSEVRDFIKANQGTTLFPIYDGDKDFHLIGGFVPTHVLMPLCEKQKNGIKSLMENEGYYHRNLIEHLSYLNDGEYPEHLKVDKIIKKKGKVRITKRIPPKRYIDLDTGEEYIQEADGKMTKNLVIKSRKEDKLHE